MPSLTRLFPRDMDGYQRSSAVYETPQQDGFNLHATDPWRVVVNFAKKSKDCLSQGLRWLGILATSGVDVPDTTFIRFAALLIHYENPLSDALLLVKAALASIWLKSLGRQSTQSMFATLHSQYSSHLVDCLKENREIAAP